MTIQTSVKSNANSKLADTSMTDAIAQFKEATSSMYDAVGSIGNATAANAKVHLNEGKARAIEWEAKAEEVMKARPLVTLGVAFAAGLLVSYLLKRRFCWVIRRGDGVKSVSYTFNLFNCKMTRTGLFYTFGCNSILPWIINNQFRTVSLEIPLLWTIFRLFDCVGMRSLRRKGKC
jgi:ElaB/YqjD/DUF883 family membrane-anchored ribosome-binding protein